MKKLTLVRGLPGSGKSTLAKQLDSGLNTDHFEADMYFHDDKTGAYNFDAGKLGSAHAWCHYATNESIKKERHVIVSNTFTTIKELRPYFDIALSHGILPSVILAQNQFKNVHDVPQDALDRMKTRFMYDISPLISEYQGKLELNQLLL